ncbi:MAG: hypothetical protein Q9208_004920, partial [Pyrenodesmia sp. 3 TL-2023]
SPTLAYGYGTKPARRPENVGSGLKPPARRQNGMEAEARAYTTVQQLPSGHLQWHDVSSREWQGTVGFGGNPSITWGALNEWVMLQGQLHTLVAFEIEAPTLSERLKYRHHRVMLELMGIP